MNKRIKKKKQSELQKAWNVVAQHLRDHGKIAYFISPNYSGNPELDIHTAIPKKTILVSTLNKKGKA